MTYIRVPIIAAGIATVFAIGGAFAVVALLVAGYVSLVGLILYSIREHGPADPPPARVTQLRQRQVTEYCRGREVRR